MRQVYPGGSALTDAVLAALYDYPDLGPPPARWLRANMVASLDGAATADGPDDPAGQPELAAGDRVTVTGNSMLVLRRCEAGDRG